ncbi:cyanobactin maturation protease PatG family protein [Massilia pseudoviolaceinigra]|uniref:cyanobactin maturation protease PatG family protein n=1 Tax=Massilia pseudoviolaceinigra TaxID=3057165 RepID=UPI002796BDB2|nr:hypothetical protein [Massilia sp. CCM 9206]MDQ1919263.1 hypothetical protein [Massilia sp. CCM 9206]
MNAMQPETSPLPANVPGSPAATASAAPCPDCAGKARTSVSEQYVYAIGQLEVRFPSLGIEREYQQRECALRESSGLARGARICSVLERNPHLAMRMSYIFLIDGMPAYAINPAGGFMKEALFDAVAGCDDQAHFCVLVGRTGTFAAAPAHGGLLLTTVSADQLYNFSLSEWVEGLTRSAQPVLESRKIDPAHFDAVARNLFRDTSRTPENLGATEGHRALNYLLVQHPGIFLAAAERPGHHLAGLETRVHQTVGGRRHVIVILAFVDRATGVAERLYCTVDVTEEWPFVVGTEASTSALGLAPFVDSAMYAVG